VQPIGEFTTLGYYQFEYYIKESNESQIKETLTFKSIELKDVFEIGVKKFDPESNIIQIYLENKENLDLGKTKIKLTSDFFTLEKEFDVGPYGKEEFSLTLDKEEFSDLFAGFYAYQATITVDNVEAQLSGNLEFVEKDIVKTTEENYGLLIRTTTITKSNEGNAMAPSELVINKNIISRLFTSFEPVPDRVERDGTKITYVWSKVLNPGESYDIKVNTNWIFPFLLIILVIAVVVLAKRYSMAPLSIRKKVGFVRAKGSEFALKVTLQVQARKYIEKVNIIERLPAMVKLYERFGAQTPSKVDIKKKRLEWNFKKLESGEKRTLSYIIYSKVGVLGKFALPQATGHYEQEGTLHETTSNRAYFVSEQQGGEDAQDE